MMPLPPVVENLLNELRSLEPETIGGSIVLGITAVLLVRAVRLGLAATLSTSSGQETERAAALGSVWLPRLFPSRKEKLAAKAELVRSETDLLLARLDNARAVGGLAVERVELEKILTSVAGERAVRQQPNRTRTLTMRHIEQVLRSLPQAELPADLRQSLLELFAARLHEQCGGDR
jgi:hypothetical protein